MKSIFSHVSLLVPSVEQSAQYLESLGFKCNAPQIFEGEGTKEIYVGSYEENQGLLLLVEAVSEGPYRRAMNKRGPSLHHIAIDVLNLDEILKSAQASGWKLHPVSQNSIPDYQTAWLYLEGIPTLIELHQKKKLSQKPLRVSNLGIDGSPKQIAFFTSLGLEGLISGVSNGTSLTIDGVTLLFHQIAGLKF